MAKRKLDNETLQPIGDQVTLDPADILVVEEDNLRHFPPTAAEISALADSIKKNGQMQPVLVRALGVEDAFSVMRDYLRHPQLQTHSGLPTLRSGGICPRAPGPGRFAGIGAGSIGWR